MRQTVDANVYACSLDASSLDCGTATTPDHLAQVTQLSLSDVSIRFGANTILSGVTFTVAAGERWGVIGRNGSGKTSLFRVITGEFDPTDGAVARDPTLRVSLLDQHRDFGDATTVWDAAALPWSDVIALEASIAAQAAAMADLGHDVPPAMLDKYGADMDRFAHAEGYTFHARVDAVLQGLGFDAEESKTRRVATLSGGERGRVGLAGQIAAPADMLLLDEPTNHLDLETTDWLQQYLRDLDETVLVISHDRAFLDEIANHVLHLEAGTATAYRGGYSSFVRQRAESRLTLERQHAKQQAMIAREEDYIRRNIAGQNTAQAKGRRKRLERLPRLTPPPGTEGAMSLRLEIAERSGDRVVVVEHLTVGVDGRTLIRNFTATANRGDVVALVGPNGAGKTTLLATLLGERAPQQGEGRLGSSVTPAYFRQNLEQLPLDKSLYDTIADQRPLWTRGGIQNHLGCFGFSGEEVFRSTRSLSGGERARMALALIVLLRANLLILDEPTNHLDVESIEALEDAIDDYDGTVILVSHDRALLRELEHPSVGARKRAHHRLRRHVRGMGTVAEGCRARQARRRRSGGRRTPRSPEGARANECGDRGGGARRTQGTAKATRRRRTCREGRRAVAGRTQRPACRSVSLRRNRGERQDRG